MFLATISEFLGTTWWSILVFLVGAIVGQPIWQMIKSKMKF